MSTNKTKLLDPGLCRCCKSMKKCRLLTVEYDWMGKKEVYGDMIMDCFGLLLSYLDGETSDIGVCATCVVRLRDASAFRQQVLQCEETFLQAKLKDNEGDDKTMETEVKIEPAESKDNDIGLEPNDSGNDDDDDGLNAQTEDESEEEPLVTNEKKGVKRKSNRIKLLPAKIKNKKCQRLKQSSKATLRIDYNKLQNKLKSALHKEDLKKPVVKAKQEPHKEYNDSSDQQFLSEDNIISIIENSFVYPFKNRSNNFYCFYCKEYCAKPEDLRSHTWSHDPKTFKNIMTTKKFYYVDVTRIDCRLCPEVIDNLDAFKSHAVQAHTKVFHANIADAFIQFRLTFTDLVCCICQQVFFDFNAIVKHMVDHYSNFTCDICGLCFLEETRLLIHMRSHRAEEKHPCEVCGKVFKSKFYKDSHVDTVHNKIPTIRCPKCDEMFLSYTQRNKHLVETHGMNKTFPCNMCDKVYDRRKTLTEHQRRTHLKVLKHRCEYCDQRFYLPSRLKEHMATHTGERNIYTCNSCDKSYPRLKSLQDHIKSHEDDARFRCNMCGEGFPQTVNLRNHIKSLHPECDIEGFF